MRNVVQDWCVARSRRSERDEQKARDKDEQSGPDNAFSTIPPSEKLKMLVSTIMTRHDDENHVDGPYEMATWECRERTVVTEFGQSNYGQSVFGHRVVPPILVTCLVFFQLIVLCVLPTFRRTSPPDNPLPDRPPPDRAHATQANVT